MIHVLNIHSYFLFVYFYLLLWTLCCGFGFLLSFYFALLLHLFSPGLGRWLFVFVTVSLDCSSPFIITSENGKTAKTMNADSAAPKQKMKEVEPKKVVKTLEEEDSSEEEDGYTNSSSDFSSDSDTDSDVVLFSSVSLWKQQLLVIIFLVLQQGEKYMNVCLHVKVLCHLMQVYK